MLRSCSSIGCTRVNLVYIIIIIIVTTGSIKNLTCKFLNEVLNVNCNAREFRSYHGTDHTANIDGVTTSRCVTSWVFSVFEVGIQYLETNVHHFLLELGKKHKLELQYQLQEIMYY